MPVMSYLAYPVQGHVKGLEHELARLPGVECMPSEKGEVFIVVTDTPDEQSESALQQRLRMLEGLEALVLVSAFADEVA